MTSAVISTDRSAAAMWWAMPNSGNQGMAISVRAPFVYRILLVAMDAPPWSWPTHRPRSPRERAARSEARRNGLNCPGWIFHSTIPSGRMETWRGSTPRKEAATLTDADVMGAIERLAHEEHELREREGREGISDHERERLQEIELRLDQCWDFLRQRRARLAAGLDPDEAEVRDVGTVENYLS